MILRRHFLVWVFLIVGSHGYAQEFPFIQFGQNEGLAHLQIMDITQDRNGNLWLGTATRSVYRFDGKSFFQYKVSIKENSGSLLTLKVLPDTLNQLWILTNLGLVKFDGEKAALIYQEGNLLPGFACRLFKDQSEKVWIIDNNGSVFEMLNDTLRHRKDIMDQVKGKISGYTHDNKKDLVFYSFDGNSVVVNKDRSVRRDTLPRRTEGALFAIVKTTDSEIVASESGVVEFSGGNKVHIALPDSLRDLRVRQIEKDRDGLIWLLKGGTLMVIDKNKKLHLVNRAGNQLSNDAICLFKDKDGNVWASIDINGIVKFRKQAWHKIGETKGKDITAVIEEPASGKLIFGTYNDGVIGFNRPVLVGNPVTAMTWSGNGSLLATTLQKGLFTVSKKAETHATLSKADEELFGVTVDGNRTIVSGYSAVYVMDKTKTERYPVMHNSKAIEATNPVVVDSTIFFAGRSAGLMELSVEGIIPVGPDFLRKSTIYTIKRLPWGEYLVTGEFSKVLFFDSHFKFDRAIDVDAFASNVLLAEFINRSTLLIGSNDGLFKVLLDKDRIRSIRKYGRADGFNEEELYVGSSILRKNGEIVIGTADGAYAFDFSNEELTRSSAMVYITSVDWSHKGTNENDSLSGYFRVPVNPELAHDQNSITFSYEACNLTNPNNIKFHHQLDGAENEWSPISAAREVTYSNLSPGNYTFNIQAISEDKIYGNIERYRFTIKPAFWQRSSFYVIVFLVVLLVIFLIIRLLTSYRIKQHKVNEEIRTHESVRLRKQMAMDFHDEMGNKLAGMLSQASLLKMKHPDPSLVKIFDYFETNAYAIYHGTKDFIWTIDLKSNNLREIISYLHDFGYQLFERNNITFHVENDIIDSSVDKQLPDGYNRQIILIFKEAMTNSLKHSQSKNVFFSGKVAGSVFEMTFADDGVWKNGSTNGNGIRNMHQRAGKINAALVINQRENKTEVSLSFNI